MILLQNYIISHDFQHQIAKKSPLSLKGTSLNNRGCMKQSLHAPTVFSSLAYTLDPERVAHRSPTPLPFKGRGGLRPGWGSHRRVRRLPA